MQSFSTFSRLLVNQADPFFFSFLQAAFVVLHGKSHMMHPFATVSNEFPDRTFRIRRFQQLDLCLSDHEESGLNFLILNLFNSITFQPEYLLIERDGFFNVFNCNANVLNMRYIHIINFIVNFFTKVKKKRFS